MAPGEVSESVSEALNRVGIEAMAARRVPTLSGGQQQRTALARALVSNPGLLLLDEPLSNLDGGLRRRMRREIRAIQRAVGSPTVFVTHDRDEAMELGDRIGVMREGVLLETGTPRDLYERPRFAWTASLLGEGSEIPFSRGTQDTAWEGAHAASEGAQDSASEVAVNTPLGPLVCHGSAVALDGASAVWIREEHVRVLGPDQSAPCNVLSGRVCGVRYLGNRVTHEVGVGPATLQLTLQVSSPRLEAEEGADIRVHLPPRWCVPVRRDGPG